MTSIGYNILTFYLPAIAVFIATVGNLVTLIVFSMKCYHGSVGSMLYRALAVAQALYVVISDGFHTLSLNIGKISIFAYNRVTCKVFIFMQMWLRALVAWVLVLIALQRVIGVVLPHRAKLLNTTFRYKCFLLGISLCFLVLYAPLFAAVGHHELPDKERKYSLCVVHLINLAPWYTNGFYQWMTIVMVSLLPFVIIITFNVAIAWAIIKSCRLCPSSTNSNSRPQPVIKRKQLILLMSVSITFVLMSLPFPLYILLAFYDIGYSEETLGKLNGLGILAVLGPVCDTITNSVTIVFYCLSGTKFRQCLKKLFCPKCTDT